MKISVFGTRELGLVTAACLADFGNKVVCMETDRGRVEQLRQGTVESQEPGLKSLVQKGLESGLLTFNTNWEEELGDTRLIVLASEAEALGGVATNIGPHIGTRSFIMIKSLVTPGTTDHVSKILRATVPHQRFAAFYNPEFLREGSAVKDFLRPRRILAGVAHPFGLREHRPAEEEDVELQLLYELYRPRRVSEDFGFYFTGACEAERHKYTAAMYQAAEKPFPVPQEGRINFTSFLPND